MLTSNMFSNETKLPVIYNGKCQNIISTWRYLNEGKAIMKVCFPTTLQYASKFVS